jgi:hypothetical protein
MILKIKKKEGNWIYFDGIKRVDVDCCENYKLTQIIPDELEKNGINDFREFDRTLGIRELTKNSDKDGRRDIIVNSILHVNEFALDEQEVLKQYHMDEKGRAQYWSVKMLYVYDKLNDMKAIACYSWNDDVYLLNDEGKTIERL